MIHNLLFAYTILLPSPPLDEAKEKSMITHISLLR